MKQLTSNPIIDTVIFAGVSIETQFDESGELWYSATDLCHALQLSDVKHTIALLGADCIGTSIVNSLDGAEITTIFINVDGLNTLVGQKPMMTTQLYPL